MRRWPGSISSRASRQTLPNGTPNNVYVDPSFDVQAESPAASARSTASRWAAARSRRASTGSTREVAATATATCRSCRAARTRCRATASSMRASPTRRRTTSGSSSLSAENLLDKFYWYTLRPGAQHAHGSPTDNRTGSPGPRPRGGVDVSPELPVGGSCDGQHSVLVTTMDAASPQGIADSIMSAVSFGATYWRSCVYGISSTLQPWRLRSFSASGREGVVRVAGGEHIGLLRDALARPRQFCLIGEAIDGLRCTHRLVGRARFGVEMGVESPAVLRGGGTR